MAAMGAQPEREGREMPQLAQVYAELEKTVLVQRRRRAAARVRDCREAASKDALTQVAALSKHDSFAAR